ncbi:MAG: PleD family two-component system response regulator [Alphaproteobacteria bacterium]|nr:PleD family two-component system response regulator [Alphaproteobacteria bacterium]
MSARALVVDDIAANVRLLEAKLLVEYYEVLTANDGATVLEIVADSMPDIVLLDVMMPGMDGFEVCQRIKETPATVYIPVVMVTALSEVSDRVKGLEAGADAFLTKPVNDLALFAWIRSLVRLKRAMDEWRARESTFTQFGLNNTIAPEDTDPSMLQVLLVADEYGPSQRIVDTLSEEGYSVEHSTSIDDATIKALDGDFHLILVDDRVGGNDVLRFCSQLRSSGVTRHSPILIMLDDGDTERLAKVLDLGVNDYLVRPVNKNELTARAKTQIRRKQFEDNLSQQYEKSLTVGVTDSLTGLYNRRYLETYFEELSSDLRGGGKPTSLLIMDVDHFKAVNDDYGHAAGDEVLRGLTQRVLSGIRGFDTAIRLGGEEFVMLMPNVDGGSAVIAANRLREMIDVTPFEIDDKGQTLKVTMSIGVATGAADEIALNDLLERADQALYTAKNGGPNRVEVADDLPVDSDPLPEAARA